MLMPIYLMPTASAERSRLLSVNQMRHRALERLYQRRETISDLIRSLEDYERLKDHRESRLVEARVAR